MSNTIGLTFGRSIELSSMMAKLMSEFAVAASFVAAARLNPTVTMMLQFWAIRLLMFGA